MLQGSGKFDRTGIGTDRDAKESSNTAFSYLKANGKRISGTISTDNKDYIINYQDLQGIGMTGKVGFANTGRIMLNRPRKTCPKQSCGTWRNQHKRYYDKSGRTGEYFTGVLG